jgi:hypothetical protein
VTKSKIDAQIERLMRKEVELARLDQQYKDENKIEFFDTKPNPGPNPLQAALLEAWLDLYYLVFTFTGANRIGKTTIGTLIALSTLFGVFPWNKKRLYFPHSLPRKVRYIGQDWHNQIEKVLIPEIRKWWPKNRPVKRKGNGIVTDTLWTDVKTGSTLEIMSNLQDSDVHEGWQGDLIVYDEPPKEDIRDANARGLIDRNGRELFCMTLLKEAWVSQKVIKKMNKDGTPDQSVFNIHGDIWQNVGFGISKKGVEEFINKLEGDDKKIAERIKGVPSYMSGLVYPKFKRQTHLVKPFDIPLDWMVDIAIDVHPRECQAILFMATTPQNLRYVFHEIWDHGDGKWIGESIVKYVSSHKLRVNRVIVDPLAKGDKNNENTTFDKIDNVLYQHGMVLDTATKDKQSGIIEVNKHLMGPNNEPSMFFFNNLRRTIMEMENYMYNEDTQKPQDKDDHMPENLYRLLLENTEWYPMDAWDDDEDDYVASGASKVTGY